MPLGQSILLSGWAYGCAVLRRPLARLLSLLKECWQSFENGFCFWVCASRRPTVLRIPSEGALAGLVFRVA